MLNVLCPGQYSKIIKKKTVFTVLKLCDFIEQNIFAKTFKKTFKFI